MGKEREKIDKELERRRRKTKGKQKKKKLIERENEVKQYEVRKQLHVRDSSEKDQAEVLR